MDEQMGPRMAGWAGRWADEWIEEWMDGLQVVGDGVVARSQLVVTSV